MLVFTFQAAADIGLREQQRRLVVDFGIDNAKKVSSRKLLHTELQFITQFLDYNQHLPANDNVEVVSESGSSTRKPAKRLKR